MKMTVNSLNTTANETQPANCINLSSLTLRNLGMTIAYGLLLVTSFSGNFLIVRVIYKIKTMRTTINFFIVNMAMSDLLFPVFVFPLLLTEICQRLPSTRKNHLPGTLSVTVYFQLGIHPKPYFDRSGSICGCGFSTSLPNHQLKTVSICHPDNVDSCDCFLISNVGLL